MKKINNLTAGYYSDEWYTDEATAELCFGQLGFIPKKVLCPFDTANSAFVKMAHQMGSTPIYGMRDFLTETYEADAIVTNPPFSIKDHVIRRCYEYGIPAVLVMPLDALGGVNRHNMYNQYGQPKVYVPARRIAYYDQTGNKRQGANFHSVIMTFNAFDTPTEMLILE